MIRFHPSAQQLVSFVDGNLSPAVSLMVSAHCDMCSTCQRFVEQETERLAGSLLEDNGFKPVDLKADYSAMIAQITQSPSSVEADTGTQQKQSPRRQNTITEVSIAVNDSIAVSR